MQLAPPGADEQVAGAQPSARRRAIEVHVRDEQPGPVGQADRPSHPASDVRWRERDTEPRRLVCALEGQQQFAQEVGELRALVGIECPEQPVLVRQVRGRRLVEAGMALRRQRDQRAAAVLRVGVARHEPGGDEPVDPHAHGPRREPERIHQLPLRRRAAEAPQRREDLEVGDRQVVLGEQCLELLVEARAHASQPGDNANRGGVEIRPQLAPVVDHLVDRVA
jgi:hypothetical protein